MSFRRDLEETHYRHVNDVNDIMMKLQDETLALRDEAIGALQRYLESGAVIAKQGGEWHLFAPGGDSLESASDLVGLIIRLGEKP